MSFLIVPEGPYILFSLKKCLYFQPDLILSFINYLKISALELNNPTLGAIKTYEVIFLALLFFNMYLLTSCGIASVS